MCRRWVVGVIVGKRSGVGEVGSRRGGVCILGVYIRSVVLV